jgi:hypothetical protein
LYISDTINSYEVNDPGFKLSKIEMIWAVVYFGSDKYLIGCIYRPKEFVDMNDFDLIFKHAREYVDRKGVKELLIMGDFNFPLINWSNGYVSAIAKEIGIGHNFSRTLSDTFLYQHVNSPTFHLPVFFIQIYIFPFTRTVDVSEILLLPDKRFEFFTYPWSCLVSDV